MERMICQCCGEALRKRGDVYVCGYCGATYRDDQAEGAADLLKGLLDDFKLEQLSNARRRLYETTHEKYPSSQAVTQAAGNVLSINPDDFMARVYLHSHDSDPHELIGVLARSEVSEWEAKETVDWLVRSLDMRTLAAVKDFADRHLKGTGKTEALNRIEDEAFKLDSGVYDLSLKRDVFLCYSTEDMPRVIEVMETFEENGLSCFAAFRNLRHGKGAQENYQEAIFRAMKNCRVFVFLSSNSSRDPNRKGVAEELDHLVSDLPKKPRVEYLLEDYPERMPILAKRRMEEAFPHLEHCRDVDDLIVRVSGLLDAEENAERDRVRKIAEEAASQAREAAKAEFEAIEAERAKQQKELEEERRRLEKEKLELEKRKPEDKKKKDPGAKAIGKKESASGKPVESSFKVEILDSGEAKIEKFLLKNASEVVIPRTYGGFPVTAIGEDAFRDCASLKSVTIPDCIKTIDECAFRDCTSLDNVSIPESVVSIGRSVFSHCASLKSIFIPKSVEKIGFNPFVHCSALTSIQVAADNPTYDSYDNCNAIIETATKKLISGCAKTVIREDINSIDSLAFCGCESLVAIAIPRSVTSIKDSAFAECPSLATLVIPSSVTTLGYSVFARCPANCAIHFGHKKPLFGYPDGFDKNCLFGFKGKVYWGGK